MSQNNLLSIKKNRFEFKMKNYWDMRWIHGIEFRSKQLKQITKYIAVRLEE